MPGGPSPSSTPLPNIHTLLSSLRSGIFQTSHNPANYRTGSKYLRRRLVGPSAIQYYPRLPSLKVLNALTPWNPYGNWRGEGSEVYKGRVIASGSAGQKGKWGSAGAEAVEGEGRETRWVTQGAVLPAREAVPEGWREVTRIRGAGWVDDAKERLRREEVDLARAAGRGPPKKGQGKRSQMKKR